MTRNRTRGTREDNKNYYLLKKKKIYLKILRRVLTFFTDFQTKTKVFRKTPLFSESQKARKTRKKLKNPKFGNQTVIRNTTIVAENASSLDTTLK